MLNAGSEIVGLMVKVNDLLRTLGCQWGKPKDPAL
jgi:hypothetical protein